MSAPSEATKKTIESCASVDKRATRLLNWCNIYDKAQREIISNLGVDKEQVYAACKAIETASREIGIIENVLRNLGILDDKQVQQQSDSHLIGYVMSLPVPRAKNEQPIVSPEPGSTVS